MIYIFILFQAYLPINVNLEPESPTAKIKLQPSYGEVQPYNGVTRYQNGAFRQQNGNAQHLYQKNPSTPQLTPRLPHKSIHHRTPEETSLSSMEHQFHISEDNASTYMVVEPDYLDPNDPGYGHDPMYYDGYRPNFRNSGIVILGYHENENQESGEF